ncbi:GNAT family N-acetyltransferase [bacterium 210820-DFI.6.37]|nr:GNAT family N-acetyltransferase [bacterium 210820-DFI.6.37]
MEIKELYKLEKQDQEKLILTFMDAFRAYPKLTRAFPEKAAKDAALEATLRYYVAYDMEYGAAFSTDEEIKDGVCIVHSDDMEYTKERHIKAGSYSPEYQAAMDRLSLPQQQRRVELFDELDQLEKEISIPFPHLYADFLGVREAFQRQGRGRKLMRAVCDYAQKQGLPVMLFTNTDEDVAFYQSLGFKVIGIVESDRFGFINTYLLKEV